MLSTQITKSNIQPGAILGTRPILRTTPAGFFIGDNMNQYKIVMRMNARGMIGTYIRRSNRWRKVYFHGSCEHCNAEMYREMSPSKGQYRFCSPKCKGQYLQAGNRSPNWRGGRKITSSGYVLLYCPIAVGANPTGYILEHRLVLQGVLGRPMKTTEAVHHKDGNRANNHPENLKVMLRGNHAALHLTCTEERNHNEL